MRTNDFLLVKNASVLGLRTVLILIMKFYTTKLILENLGVIDYGIYSTVYSCVLFFDFIQRGVSGCYQRFYNYELAKRKWVGGRKVFCSALIIQACLSCILVVLINVFGNWFIENKMILPEGKIEETKVIFNIFLIGIFFIMMNSVLCAAIIAHEDMQYYSLISIGEGVGYLMVAWLLGSFERDKLIIYTAVQSSIPVILFFMNYIWLKRKYTKEIKFKAIYGVRMIRKMLGFSLWSVIGNLGSALEQQGINLLLNSYFGVVVNVSRGIAAQVFSGVFGLVSNIGLAIRPQIVKSYADGNFDRVKRLMYLWSRYGFLGISILFVPICIEIDWILKFWLGENVPEWTNSFICLSVVIALMNMLNAPVSGVINATGKIALYQSLCLGVNVLIFPLSYLALMFFEKPDVPYVIGIILSIIVQYLSLIVLRKYLLISFKEYIKEVIVPVIVPLMAILIVIFVFSEAIKEGFFRLIVLFLLAGFVGIGVYSYLFASDVERDIAKKLTRKNI